MPAGCPHRVLNLKTSVAVSGNFVDSSNLARACEELRIDGLRNPLAEDLRRQLIELGHTDEEKKSDR